MWYNYETDDTKPGYWLSRAKNIASSDGSPADSAKYAEYTYLGAGTVVQVKYPAVTVSGSPLVLTYGTGGTYGGFDRFGRIVDQKWEISGGATKDRYTYGYDYNSNRLYRENVQKDTLSQLYHADGASLEFWGHNTVFSLTGWS